MDVATNKTYDAVGSGMPDSQFAKQWPTVKSRITDHLTYADYVPVDVSSLSATNKAIVLAYVEGRNNPRVFVIGIG